MKWALIHLGSDIAYGMTFFAGELIKNGHEIHWFDGDRDILDDLTKYDPKYICFGPLSSEFETAINVASKIKKELPWVLTVFGGHHVKAVPEELVNRKVIDYLVIGPCYNIIDKILSSTPRILIKGSPVNPELMIPALEDYYQQIPRIGARPRTYIMSHFGCVYNCSFCCTDILRNMFGNECYKNFWLRRRPVKNLIQEAEISKRYGMKEIGLNDDDFLYDTRPGGKGTSWIREFVQEWKKIELPIYANVTPITVIRAENEAISLLSSIAKTVQMGVETFYDGSKKLFNRSFQNEEQIIQACERLVAFNLKIKLEVIVGLPNIDNLVPDPVEDAIHTLQACQRISKRFPGKIKAQCNNLVLFPGTKLWKRCIECNIPRREAWKNALYESKGSIIFEKKVEKQIRNIVKMTTMFVKFNTDEEWIRALIDMDLTDSASKKLSECNYLDSLTFRLGNELVPDFQNIIKEMSFKY